MDWQFAARSPKDEGRPWNLLKLLIQQIPWGVLTIDAATRRVVLANSEMERLLGIPGLGTEGNQTVEWTGRRPDGRPYGPGEWPHDRALSGTPVAEPEDIEIVRPDGSPVRVRMSAISVSDGEQGPAEVLVTCVDQSAQRTVVNSRKFLAEANMLFASSLDHRTTLRNLAQLAVPALADWCTIDLLGVQGSLDRVAVEHISPRKSRAAAQLSRRHPPRMDSRLGIARSVQDGHSQLIEEVCAPHLDQLAQTPAHRKLLEELGMRSLMIVPLVARGKTIGAIAFVSAESRRRYASEDLELAEELASRAALAIENARLLDESRAATEAKSDFLAVMSHELRTPLTAIIGYSELLQMGIPEPVTTGQCEQAERIEASARHLLQLIEEILGLVILDSGEDRTRDHWIHVNELLGRAAGIAEPLARAKGLTFRVGFAEGDATLESDPDKLIQILFNVLSNAVKFTEAGEIHLEARRSGSGVTFEVSDTGIGVDPADTPKIFEPFWQAERPITRTVGGTGLGLAIVQRLVFLLGGEIEVESAVGVGSTFRIHIPSKAGQPRTSSFDAPVAEN